MKKVAVQIDGGHLRALARQDNQKYDPDFIEKFSKALTKQGDEELLRVLYYDCPPFNGDRTRPVSGEKHTFKSSDGWLHELATRDLLAIRLGVLKWRGWKPKRTPVDGNALTDDDFKPDFEQKGVDLRIGLDLAVFAAEKSVDRIILVTGDTDLIPAMKLARRTGLQVVGVEFPGYKPNRELAAHVDFRRTLSSWPK